jgi:hypothetical protein
MVLDAKRGQSDCNSLFSHPLYYLPSQALDLDSIATHHWHIQPCSAVTGENLLEGMEWIVSDIQSRVFLLD